jgi:hypothetical protein
MVKASSLTRTWTGERHQRGQAFIPGDREPRPWPLSHGYPLTISVEQGQCGQIEHSAFWRHSADDVTPQANAMDA